MRAIGDPGFSRRPRPYHRATSRWDRYAASSSGGVQPKASLARNPRFGTWWGMGIRRRAQVPIMNPVPPRCRICQCEKADEEQWFLLIANDWEDRLKVLSWSDGLSRGQGMHAACSPCHVQQLVAHWMATGSLDYPFARTVGRSMSAFPSSEELSEFDTSFHLGKSHALGELAVHRESLRQLLMGNPESLVPVLDALVSALYQGAISEEKAHPDISDEPSVAGLALLGHQQSA
jgi:hypothetical protein